MGAGVGASQEKSFVDLLLDYSDDPKTELPDLVPLYDVAQALAADRNGKPDRDKLTTALELLNTPRVARKHKPKVVKRKPLPPPPLAFRVGAFLPSQGSSATQAQRRQAEERRQSGGMTLHEEMNQRHRAQVTPRDASDTKEVQALPLSAIRELLPILTNGSTLLDVLAIKTSTAVEKQAVPVEDKGSASETAKAREKRKREQARAICIDAGIDPEEPLPPRDLYDKITLQLQARGYTSKQTAGVKKHTNRLPDSCKPEHGKHHPAEVIYFILQKTPEMSAKVKDEEVSKRSA